MGLAPTGFASILTRRGPCAQEPCAQWNRGAYLVEHLGHCGECHTPRDFLGAKDEDRKLAGNPKGPDGKKVPNITPDPEHGIGRGRPDLLPEDRLPA